MEQWALTVIKLLRFFCINSTYNGLPLKSGLWVIQGLQNGTTR